MGYHYNNIHLYKVLLGIEDKKPEKSKINEYPKLIKFENKNFMVNNRDEELKIIRGEK